MSDPLDEPTADRQEDQEDSEDPEDPEGPEDPRLSALIEALARGDAIDWQEAESAADSAEEKERIRALSAISEVATFHRTWLAEVGLTGDLDEDDEPDEEIPTHWGELEILERVGRGSFGDVYKAREPRLDRIVALKLIRASARTPEREAETLREGRLLAKVRHPNVATVHGAAGADGRVGFWMEFLEGKNLAEILAEKGRFEPREAAEIGIALCRALSAVHAQGIVHRDVKAQNVVRENDGRIVLTDFGVGRATTLLETEEPSLSGTPLYLAPELFEGKAPSPASDIYALGVLLFYLVTGEFPVTGSSFDELRAAHRERKRRWLKELRKELPGSFVAAVERALDRDPGKRPPSALEMKGDLSKADAERIARRKRRWQWIALSLVVFVAVVTIFYFVRARNEAAFIKAQQKSAALTKAKNHAAAVSFREKALRLHKESRLQEAIDALEEAKRRDPEFATVRLQLVSYKSGLGQYHQSLQEAQDAAAMCEKFTERDCLQVKARLAIQQLDYKGALEYFQRAAQIKSDDQILQEIVQLYRNLVQPNQAIDGARKLEKSDDPVAAGELALTFSAAGSDREARAALAEWRHRFPNDKYLPWIAGPVAMASGKASEAERQFKALATQHGDAEGESNGLLLWAKTLLLEGKLTEARKLLNRSASLNNTEGFDRNEAIRTILLAKCFVDANDREGASEKLRSILEQQKISTNLKLFRNAALIALEARELDLAQQLSSIVHSLASQPRTDLSESFDLQLQGEFSWRQKKDFKGAFRSLDRAWTLRADPQNALSFAHFYLAQGNCDLALDYLDKVVEMHGLIIDDFYAPWTIWNEAVELRDRCSK